MQKHERQQLIKELIEAEPITRQSVIAEHLASLGQMVTQASVSRDLEELGILKIDGVYHLAKRTQPVDFGPYSIEPAGTNLLVGRCASGMASAITVRIDAANIAEIVGTIAGDDTIFIAVRDAAEQANADRQIRELFAQ